MPVKKDTIHLEFARLTEAIQNYSPDFDIPRFQKAFAFAENAHEGQLRKEDKPYIIHPLETARILTHLHVDEDTLIAALLHDVPEDTPHTIAEIDSLFGSRVSFLVDGITKLSKVHYQNDMEQRQVESLKKLLLHSAQDHRVVLIKLADRLHNMRTLHFIDKPEKRTRIARETLEIFVPIANLFGVEHLKTELEELCFFHLYPEDYKAVKEYVEESLKRTKPLLNKTVSILHAALEKHHIKNDITMRKRSLYGIYKKLKQNNKNFDEIYDVVPLRILVNSVDECYKVLGNIHLVFRPKPGKFKDYIAVPKLNGYQSLHTTVFGPEGVITKIQIRTHVMDIENEFGIAAHYFSSRKEHQKMAEDERFEWIKKALDKEDLKKDDNTDFMENLKEDIFQDRIFVFTPKGDVVNLPIGATGVDFAFSIHTEVGNKALYADINGERHPITDSLKTGETVHIVTSSSQTSAPPRKWLNFAKTNLARDSIRNFYKQSSKKLKIRLGKELFTKELNLAGVLLDDLSERKILKTVQIVSLKKIQTMDALYVEIAEDTLDSVKVVKALIPKQIAPQTSVLRWFWQLFSKFRKPQIGLKILCEHRVGMYRDILNVFAKFGMNITSTSSSFPFFSKFAIIKIYIETPDFDRFTELCQHLEQVDGVQQVQRFFMSRNILFLFALVVVCSFFMAHPFIIQYLLSNLDENAAPGQKLLSNVLLYGGFFLLFGMILYLKNVTQKNFLQFEQNRSLWIATFVATTVAFIAIVFEIYIFHIRLDWLVVGSGIALMYIYLIHEYIQHYSQRHN